MEKIIKGGIGVTVQLTPNKYLHYLESDITITNSQMQTTEVWQKVGWIPMQVKYTCKLCEETSTDNHAMLRIKIQTGKRNIQRTICRNCLNLLNQGGI